MTPGWLERAVRAGFATQRRPTPPARETPNMTDADRDEIVDRLLQESQARVKESRKLIEASKRTRNR